MKKLIITSVLGLIVAASTSTAFGQGYIVFGGGLRSVWDDTGATPAVNTTFDVTFLWSATVTPSPVGGILGSCPTNNTYVISLTAAWADIEGATNSGWTAGTTGGAAIQASPVNATGAFLYNGGTAVALDGPGAGTSAGEVINFFVFGWETDDGLYTTLASAEAYNANVGWASVFSYTLGAAPPATPPAETAIPKFMIGPEPTTLPLIGLGGFLLLFFRRRRGNETLINPEPRRTVASRIKSETPDILSC